MFGWERINRGYVVSKALNISVCIGKLAPLPTKVHGELDTSLRDHLLNVVEFQANDGAYN